MTFYVLVLGDKYVVINTTNRSYTLTDDLDKASCFYTNGSAEYAIDVYRLSSQTIVKPITIKEGEVDERIYTYL